MLKPVKPTEISALEDDLGVVAENLRKVRQLMQTDQIEALKLQVDKAAFYLEWLKDWAVRTEASSRVQAAKIKAARASDERSKKKPKT